MSTTSKRPGRHQALAVILTGFAALLVAAAASLWLLRSPGASSASIGGPFHLTRADGTAATDRDFRGRYLLVYFGYTSCPDVCPTTLQAMTAAVDDLGGKSDRVQPLFVTIDPGRDTPAVVGAYTAAISPRLIGLTGTPEEIAAVEKSYRVYAAIQPNAADPKNYSVDHSSVIYLIDPAGSFVAPIRADAPSKEIAAELQRHLS